MALTRPDIPLPANTYVDLYAALNAQSGFPTVTVGTKVTFQNKGSASVLVTAKGTTPDSDDGSISVSPSQFAINESGDDGAFVVSPIVDGVINAGVSI